MEHLQRKRVSGRKKPTKPVRLTGCHWVDSAGDQVMETRTRTLITCRNLGARTMRMTQKKLSF
jgi:hypothetical protein